jgi:hypothetical protein
MTAKLYPLADGEHQHVTGRSALRVAVKLIGEIRPPRQGEWYLWGQKGHMALDDLLTPCPICQLFDPSGDREYLVTWQMTVSTGQGFRDAAIRARQAQIRPNTIATVFEVVMVDQGKPIGETATVDLAEGAAHCGIGVDHEPHVQRHPQGLFSCPGGPDPDSM